MPMFAAFVRLWAAIEVDNTGAHALPSKLPSAFWASSTLSTHVWSAVFARFARSPFRVGRSSVSMSDARWVSTRAPSLYWIWVFSGVASFGPGVAVERHHGERGRGHV